MVEVEFKIYDQNQKEGKPTWVVPGVERKHIWPIKSMVLDLKVKWVIFKKLIRLNKKLLSDKQESYCLFK